VKFTAKSHLQESNRNVPGSNMIWRTTTKITS